MDYKVDYNRIIEEIKHLLKDKTYLVYEPDYMGSAIRFSIVLNTWDLYYEVLIPIHNLIMYYAELDVLVCYTISREHYEGYELKFEIWR